MLRSVDVRFVRACAFIVCGAIASSVAVADPLTAVDTAAAIDPSATPASGEAADTRSAGIVSVFLSETHLTDLDAEAFED